MKIISTVGPVFNKNDVFKKLYKAGCAGFRFNATHANKDSLTEQLKYIHERNFGETILDLPGHKIRVGVLEEPIILNNGDTVLFKTPNSKCSNVLDIIEIPLDTEIPNELILTAKNLYSKDGNVIFEKTENTDCDNLIFKVNGCTTVYSHNGINAPYIDRLDLPLSKKDKKHILFALNNRVSHIYASFIVSPKYITSIHGFINEQIKNNRTLKKPLIYSKIETFQGIQNFDEILKVSDGIVLGRGDLYTETSIYSYPRMQATIINKMKKNKKELIIATHILPSLQYKDKATTNEVCELYNLLQNKVNGVVLVAETSVAKNPWGTVKFANQFIKKNEI